MFGPILIMHMEYACLLIVCQSLMKVMGQYIWHCLILCNFFVKHFVKHHLHPIICSMDCSAPRSPIKINTHVNNVHMSLSQCNHFRIIYMNRPLLYRWAFTQWSIISDWTYQSLEYCWSVFWEIAAAFSWQFILHQSLQWSSQVNYD